MSERRPGEAEPWRDVVGVGCDGFEELQIVAETGVESERWGELPLVLRVEAEVGVGLGGDGVAEGLGISGVVVSAIQEIVEGGEGVASSVGHGKGDGEVVEEEVGAGSERVFACLMGEVIDDFVKVVEAAGGGDGEFAEGGDAGNADGGIGPVVR